MFAAEPFSAPNLMPKPTLPPAAVKLGSFTLAQGFARIALPVGNGWPDGADCFDALFKTMRITRKVTGNQR